MPDLQGYAFGFAPVMYRCGEVCKGRSFLCSGLWLEGGIGNGDFIPPSGEPILCSIQPKGCLEGSPSLCFGLFFCRSSLLRRQPAAPLLGRPDPDRGGRI